jgi:hypothetical protein
MAATKNPNIISPIFLFLMSGIIFIRIRRIVGIIQQVKKMGRAESINVNPGTAYFIDR